MAGAAKHFSPAGMFKTLLFTGIVVGLSYWLWQDVKPLLRPFKGDVWKFAKDLNILVNGAGLFLLVTMAGMVFDRSGAEKISTRIIAGALMIGVVAILVIYGRYYPKEIVPFFTSFNAS